MKPYYPAHMRRSHSAGFTLAEMAIVVLLVSIMMTMGLSVLKAQTDSAAYSVTNKKQAAIKDALVAYLRSNWRLPCPDTNFIGGTAPLIPDGLENRVGANTTACISNFGVLPYVTLGLPREMALDGWSNYMSYHVSIAPDWSLTATFNPAAVGSIVVNSAPATPLTINAVAVVVSHGKNGNGAYTIKGSRNMVPTTADPLAVDEQENTNIAANLIYFKREFTDVPAAVGGAFDDVVMYLQAEDLLTPLRNDGSLKAETDKLLEAENSLIAATLADAVNCLPPAPVATLLCTAPAGFPPVGAPTQAFGLLPLTPICYTRNPALLLPPGKITSSAPVLASTIAITLTVGGQTRTVNVAGLRAAFVKSGVAICP